MNEVLWAVTRASALVSIVLLTTTFVLGMMTSARAAGSIGRRVVTAGLHRTLALCMVSFLGVHIVTAIVETYVDIDWWSALVPFSSTYDPVWIGLGTLSFDILLAVIITSLLRHRLSRRAWRGVHLTSYAMLPIAMLHGAMSVTTDTTLTYVVIATCGVAATAALLVRLVRIPADTSRRRLATVQVWRNDR